MFSSGREEVGVTSDDEERMSRWASLTRAIKSSSTRPHSPGQPPLSLTYRKRDEGVSLLYTAMTVPLLWYLKHGSLCCIMIFEAWLTDVSLIWYLKRGSVCCVSIYHVRLGDVEAPHNGGLSISVDDPAALSGTHGRPLLSVVWLNPEITTLELVALHCRKTLR